MLIKEIPSHPHYYASDEGKIFSTKRGKLKTLKASKGSHGYYQVTLYGEKKAVYCVHHLVLLAFKGIPKSHEECRHLDGNEENNNNLNLKWGTSKENKYDRNYVHKTGNMPNGKNHWKNK